MRGINLKMLGKWLLLLLFIILSILNFIRIDSVSHSASDTIRPFILQTAVLVVIFYFIYLFLSLKKKL